MEIEFHIGFFVHLSVDADAAVSRPDLAGGTSVGKYVAQREGCF
jgi:hypothetical protein